MLFDIQLRDFGLDLRLEFVRSRLNSFRALPICRPISGNFFGPNRIRAKEEEDHLWKAQVHVS